MSDELIVQISLVLMNLIVYGLFLYTLYKQRKEIISLQVGHRKHLDFLLKVKHDLPILAGQIMELQEQILPPETNKLN